MGFSNKSVGKCRSSFLKPINWFFHLHLATLSKSQTLNKSVAQYIFHTRKKIHGLKFFWKWIFCLVNRNIFSYTLSSQVLNKSVVKCSSKMFVNFLKIEFSSSAEKYFSYTLSYQVLDKSVAKYSSKIFSIFWKLIFRLA